MRLPLRKLQSPPTAHGLRAVAALACSALPLLTLAAGAAASGFLIYGQDSPLVAGSRAVAEGDYLRGMQLLEHALDEALSDRERRDALANLCAAQLGLSLHAAAIESCSAAIEADPRSWRNFSNRGAARLAAGQVELAVRDFSRALEIRPSAQPPRIGLEVARERRPRVPMPANHHEI